MLFQKIAHQQYSFVDIASHLIEHDHDSNPSILYSFPVQLLKKACWREQAETLRVASKQSRTKLYSSIRATGLNRGINLSL